MNVDAMLVAFRPVGEGRLREVTGLPFEAFEVGQTFHHRPGITVTQEENANEALSTLNQAAVHYDLHYAAATEFGQPLVVSTLTLQRTIGLGWKTFGRRRRILGFSDIRLTSPVFGGDTLYASTVIVDARDDPGDEDCGRLACAATLARPDGTVVAELRYEQSIYRDGRGPFSRLGY